MPDAVLKNHYVYVIDGLIKSIDQEPVPENLTRETEIINCQGNYLSPGFIDTHCHGGGGADFMDGTVQDILIAARAHLKHGTTALCPTTLTCSDQELFRFFKSYEAAKAVSEHMPHLLGIHLEGPYFSPAQAGAQPPEYLVCPKRPFPNHTRPDSGYTADTQVTGGGSPHENRPPYFVLAYIIKL